MLLLLTCGCPLPFETISFGNAETEDSDPKSIPTLFLFDTLCQPILGQEPDALISVLLISYPWPSAESVFSPLLNHTQKKMFT